MYRQDSRSCCLVVALALVWTAPQAQGAENLLSAEQIAIQLAPTKGLRPVDAPTAVRRSVDLSTVKFKFGSFELTDEARRQLNELGKALAMPAFKNTRFIIGGHTDALGSASFNKMLSEQRAEAVVAYLTRKFELGARQLLPVGWGKSRLLPGVPSDDPRQRRAEIINAGAAR